MSRHQLVKSLNVDDILDDYNGGSDYEYDGEQAGATELSQDDDEQMQEGLSKVRSLLGPEIATDLEVYDSLWHFYYDVEKTVTYLLDKRALSQSKAIENSSDKKRKIKELFTLDACVPRRVGHCFPFSSGDFFKDCPWLDIPLRRRAEIVEERLRPRGGLLGGSSSNSIHKVSKLAALAAARRKRENEKAIEANSEATNSTIMLLDTLSNRRDHPEKSSFSPVENDRSSTQTIKQDKLHQEKSPKNYATRKSQNSSPPPKESSEVSEPTLSVNEVPQETAQTLAKPSPLACIVLGSAHGSVDSSYRPQISFFCPAADFGLNNAESNPFIGPSPDDIVARAQNLSKGLKSSKSAKTSGGGDTAVNSSTELIQKVMIEDAPKAKSKNLNVVAEYGKSTRKNTANFVVIGHVDAGKSTLMGRLLFDLKVVDQRTIDKYRKEANNIGKSSFALAWVLDQGTEERTRGVTIDVASNTFSTPTTNFTILDAPGHRDFIPNMIAGASQADFAVLVVDASKGNFEAGLKGQTKEHALLVRSMGVQRLVVAINKLDSVRWSKDRFDEIQQQVSGFLMQAGFQSKNVAFVPCAGLTGDNVTHRATDLNAAWYNGPVFLDMLESSEPIAHAIESPLRMTIDDIFRGSAQNPLSISGRISAGSIQNGDRILILPASKTATIKGIDMDSMPVDWAVAGGNVVLHLTDIDTSSNDLKAGDVMCHPSSPILCVKAFSAKILSFEHIMPMLVDIHHGRLHVPGRVKQLIATIDKGTGTIEKKKPRVIQPGKIARVVLEVAVERGIPLEQGARVILREGGNTVATGLVEGS